MVTVTKARQAAERPVFRQAPDAPGRQELFARLEARKPEGRYRIASGAGLHGQDLKVYVPPPSTAPRPPEDLGEFIDDRVAGVLGSRTGLNPAAYAWAQIAEACRTGDAGKVRAAVRKASGLTALDTWNVWQALGEMKGRAVPYAFAIEVTAAAVAEAEALGWHTPPQRRRRED